MGRPTDFTEALADLICERLADGDSLKAICADEGMPSRTTIYRWLAANEAFRDMYARARDDQADTMADEITAIADTEPDTNRARVRIDARKWVAAKLKPRKYGERVELEHSGSIQTKSDEWIESRLTQLLGQAGAGIAAGGAGEAEADEPAGGLSALPEAG